MDYSKVIGIMEYLLSQLDEAYGEENEEWVMKHYKKS
jgi:hypothetical protein